MVLTGAGLSTDSGIPDYRGPNSPTRLPMTYDEFVSGPEAQQRYWARSHVGWSRMRHAAPNAGHRALAALERRRSLLITQNVDGLHEAAGSRRWSRCTAGSPTWSASAAGARRRGARCRRGWTSSTPGTPPGTRRRDVRPDGDVELDDTDGFRVPAVRGVRRVAQAGRGVLRRERPGAAGASAATTRSTRWRGGGALLVVGSSLTVMSGLRFVKRAAEPAPRW